MPARLKLSVHAQTRITERGVDLAHIKRAILEPDFTNKSFEGRILSRKTLEDGRLIEVIYSKDGFRGTNDYFIVTAYYIES